MSEQKSLQSVRDQMEQRVNNLIYTLVLRTHEGKIAEVVSCASDIKKLAMELYDLSAVRVGDRGEIL